MAKINMPPELKELYDRLPGVSVNNSREIVRQTWEKIKNKHPLTVQMILRSRFGIEAEPDYVYGLDDGEEPKHHE